MHLFTLLLTAAFSSQFTLLNGDAATETFTALPIKVDLDTPTKVTVYPGSGAALAGTVHINVSVTEAEPDAATAGFWRTTETTTVTTAHTTSATVDFAALVGLESAVLKEGDDAYVYIKHTPASGSAVIYGPLTIRYSDLWFLTHDTIYADTKVVSNIRVHGPKTADEPTSGKVKLHFAASNGKTLSELTVTKESKAGTANTWEVENFDISAVGTLQANNPIFAYLSSDPELVSNTEALVGSPISTDVETPVAQFTIAPVSIPYNQLDYFTSLTITPEAAFNLGASIKVKITGAAASGRTSNAPLEKTATLADGVYKAEFTAAEFKGILTPAIGNTYTVAVATAATGATGYLSVTKPFAFTAVPTFELLDDEIELKELVDGYSLTIKDVGGSSLAQSNAAADIYISLDPALTKAKYDATKDVKKAVANYDAAGTAVALVTADVAKFNTKTAPFNLWVYKVATDADPNTAPPTVLKVVPNAPAFTHNLTVNGITEAQLKADIPILLTPKSGDTWEADKYVVTITNKNVMPVKSGTDPVPFTFALTQIKATNTWETKLDLKAMKPWEIETNKLYAWSAKDGVYITESVPITFTPATTTTFTTPETNIIHAATGLKVPEMLITITAGGQTWNTQKTAEKLWYKIVVKPVTPSNAPVPLIEGKVTGNVTGFYIPEIPIDTFELPKPAADKPHTLIITISEDNKVSYLASEGIVTVSDVAPVPLTFTIAPATMEFATTLKSPVITITPSDATKMPPQGTGFVAKFTKGTGETAKVVSQAVAVAAGPPKVFTIPEKELADLDIKEADLPVTLKVSLWNGDAELGTAKDFKVTKVGGEEAAMGVSPLLSLLAAALLLLVKLF